MVRKLNKSGKLDKITLKDVRVGDVLKIKDNETIPADCVLLRTKKRSNGMCFVQTTDLDGERNLKPVVTSKYLDYYFNRIFLPSTNAIDFKSRFCTPTKDMYFYRGLI